MLDVTPIEVDPLIPRRDMAISEDRVIDDISIFKPSTTEFSERGLYSLEIFGPIGSSERNSNFGFIKLKLPIIVPDTFHMLSQYDKNYIKLINGEVWAKFDLKKGDFIYVDKNDKDAKNGYSFFIKYMPYIKFRSFENDTITRKDLVNKLKNIINKENSFCIIDFIPVIPAGLRDYTMGKDGRGQDHEVNDIYRKAISANNSFGEGKITPSMYQSLDLNRWNLQKAANMLWEYFMKLQEGKFGFNQDKFTKRAITYGSRNVITAMPALDIDELDLDPKSGITNNTTLIGIFQFLKTISPLAKHKIVNNISSVFIDQYTGKARLVDRKTKKIVYKTLDTKTVNQWTTSDGLEDLLNKFKDLGSLLKPAIVKDLAIAYIGEKDDDVILTQDTSNKEFKYRVATFMELFYISILSIRDNIPTTLTRFPVVGGGSIYPSYFFVITTVPSTKKKILESEFCPAGTDKAILYPDIKASIFNAVSPHYSHIPGLGGDFDGDQANTNAILTEDSTKEVEEILNNISYYINIDGSLKDTNVTDVLGFLEKHFNKPRETVIIISDKEKVYKEFPNALVIKPNEYLNSMKADKIINLTKQEIKGKNIFWFKDGKIDKKNMEVK